MSSIAATYGLAVSRRCDARTILNPLKLHLRMERGVGKTEMALDWKVLAWKGGKRRKKGGRKSVKYYDPITCGLGSSQDSDAHAKLSTLAIVC